MSKPKIIPCSQRLANGDYEPRVILRLYDGPSITERPLSWEKKFKTKEEADKYASLQAELYIKENF